jgi:hypothetical protein
MSTDDSNMTPEDRVNWLKERGVVIEFPEDRNKTNDINDNNNDTKGIVIIKIPCNDNEPCQELIILINEHSGMDELLIKLKPKFSNDNIIDYELLRKTATMQLGSDNVNVDNDTLQQLARQGSVETFSLSHACEENNYCGVNLYLDEAGQLKGLQQNYRAIQIAQLCGYDNVPLVGDMYVGRVRHFPNTPIQHENFRLPDLDSDAVWMRGVKSQNYDYAMAANKVSMDVQTPDENSILTKGTNWKETSTTIEVTYQLPDFISANNITIKFTSKTCVMKLKNASQDEAPLLNLELAGLILTDDSTWTCSHGLVEITMEKRESATWGQLESTKKIAL